MPPSTDTLGSRVAARRIALKLTQEELARRCNCALRTIARVEQGGSVYVSQRLLEALRDHLAVSIDELIAGKPRSARKD